MAITQLIYHTVKWLYVNDKKDLVPICELWTGFMQDYISTFHIAATIFSGDVISQIFYISMCIESKVVWYSTVLELKYELNKLYGLLVLRREKKKMLKDIRWCYGFQTSKLWTHLYSSNLW